jgi:hypothetical protein
MNTIEEEIKTFAGESSLTRSLRRLGILSVDEDCEWIRVVRDWERGGAETHNLVFEVGSTRRAAIYIMKACTPFSFGIPIEQVLQRWMQRRNLLLRHGVKAPRVYGAHQGILIEDFIPLKLEDLEPSQWSKDLIRQVLQFARTLSELRFAAIGPFADLMTDGQSVYLVDFGEDLGEPYAESRFPDYVNLAITWLRSLNIDSSQIECAEKEASDRLNSFPYVST